MEKVLIEMPVGARPMQRTARPLSGPEVKEAVKRHALRIAEEGAKQAGFVEGQPEVEAALSAFGAAFGKVLGVYSSLDGINIVYPKVWWHLRVIVQFGKNEDRRLPEEGLKGPHFYGHLKLGLTSVKVWELEIGEPVEEMEEDLMVEQGQAPNNVPDLVRREHGLLVTAQVRLGDGSVAEVVVRPGQERRVTSVDLGPASLERLEIPPIEPSPPEMKAEELIGEPPVVEMVGAVEQAPVAKPEVKVKAPVDAQAKPKTKPDPKMVTRVDD